MADDPVELSNAEARRIALHAQGLGRRPAAKATARRVRAAVSALGGVQLDAVNVLVRAHYLTVYSRVGPYRPALLDDLAYRRREAFEYWGHAASLLPVELHPALRWRMAKCAASTSWQAFRARVEAERPGYLAAVEREVAERGPLTFGELSDPGRRDRAAVATKYAESTLSWYRWSDGKTALEGLFDAGRLATAGRRGFERVYDLAERVIPPEVLARPTPPVDEAHRTLLRHAAAALGVGTVRDLAYYYRLPVATTRARLRELVDGGDLQPARVEGWPREAYLAPGARAAAVDARVLLSPFDSLTWERERTERLFGFRPSFELYVKAADRRYGYFVLPFLLGDALVARVDLKADRARRTLLVLGAFAEPSAPSVPAPAPDECAAELAAALRELTIWLDLDGIEVTDHGDLARNLEILIDCHE